jgi:predicted phosphodiesterase
VTCVLGNHERWALDRHSPEARAFGSGTELSDEDLAWLGTLPARWSAELAGVRVVMTHGDAEGAMPQSCPTFLAALLLDLHADVLVVGHVHEPFVIATSAGLVVNPGPCCRSTYAFERSGPILVPSRYREATFGVLDLPERRFTVCRADNGQVVVPRSRGPHE